MFNKKYKIEYVNYTFEETRKTHIKLTNSRGQCMISISIYYKRSKNIGAIFIVKSE